MQGRHMMCVSFSPHDGRTGGLPVESIESIESIESS